jgi:hypothetical protein
MARTRINSRSKDLIKDNGSVLVSVVHGEQIKLEMVLSWLTNLSGYQITAKAAEADMTGVSSSNNELPTQRTALEPAELPILDSDPADNKFDIVIPELLIANYATKPTPNAPVYAWLDLEVVDTGVGDARQVWKPFRGLIEILYSPTEE